MLIGRRVASPENEAGREALGARQRRRARTAHQECAEKAEQKPFSPLETLLPVGLMGSQTSNGQEDSHSGCWGAGVPMAICTGFATFLRAALTPFSCLCLLLSLHFALRFTRLWPPLCLLAQLCLRLPLIF